MQAVENTVIKIPNPYRDGSNLHNVFHFLADGLWHPITRITNAVYFVGAGSQQILRRRTASAIRTIRRDMLGPIAVEFDGADYRMTTPPDVGPKGHIPGFNL